MGKRISNFMEFRVNSRQFIALGLLFAFLLASCSRAPLGLTQVEVGMTQEEVLKLTGEPKRKGQHATEDFEVWTYPSTIGAAEVPRCYFDAKSKKVAMVIISEGVRKP